MSLKNLKSDEQLDAITKKIAELKKKSASTTLKQCLAFYAQEIYDCLQYKTLTAIHSSLIKNEFKITYSFLHRILKELEIITPKK
jgi:hypothetical protein